jgi:hypothetical protein
MICKVLDVDAIDLVVPRLGSSREVPIGSDLEYLSRVVDFEVVEDERSYDLVVAMMMVCRDEGDFRKLERIACKSRRVIYLESDGEPDVDYVSLYSRIRSGEYEGLRSRVTDVITTVPTTYEYSELWRIVLPEARLTFVPYITHPYYDSPPLENTGTYQIGLMGSPKSTEWRSELFREFRTSEILAQFNFVCHSVGELGKRIAECEMLIGTSYCNSKGRFFRATSKVVESLHSGAIPTFIDAPMYEGYYDYMNRVPRSLRILRFSETLQDFLHKVEVALRSEVGLNVLREEVLSYHKDDRWINVVRIILSS